MYQIHEKNILGLAGKSLKKNEYFSTLLLYKIFQRKNTDLSNIVSINIKKIEKMLGFSIGNDCDYEYLLDLIHTEPAHSQYSHIKNKNIIYIAFLKSLNSNRSAINFLKNFSDDKNIKSVSNLFYANDYINDDELWLFHINSYLSKYNVTPINLKSTGINKFERLYCNVEAAQHAGPLITVIMPAFNAASTIDMAVMSILNQSWKNLEVIIIDDASTDDTWDHLKILAAQDHRIRLLRNNVNVGPYISKNIALKIATGEFITGHDADDWAHPDRIFNQFHTFNDNVAASIGYMLRMQPSGKFSTFSKLTRFTKDGAARIAFISCMFRTQILKDMLGNWDSVRFGADSEMIARAQKILGTSIIETDVFTMLCQDTPSSLTNSNTLGINKIGGISQVRLDYKKAWTMWHTSLKRGCPALLSFPPDRKYIVPKEAAVPDGDIIKLIKNYSDEGII